MGISPATALCKTAEPADFSSEIVIAYYELSAHVSRRLKRHRITQGWCPLADRLTKTERSAHMSRVRRADTSPELAVRRLLHGMGFRYVLGGRGLAGRPDIVLPARGAVVFVHGCFRHRHARCRLATMPKSNIAFWRRKFSKNMARDRRVESLLRALGWTVLVVWSCQLRDLARLRGRLKGAISDRPRRLRVPGNDAR